MNRGIPLAVGVATLAAGCVSMQGGEGGFVDVAAERGIHAEGARSAGWADYDGDGCADLLLTMVSGIRLYRNDCQGNFIDVTTAAGLSGPLGGFGVAWADYDGDGAPDVYIASADGANALYRNRGDGTFADVAGQAGVADPRSSTGAAWADYDGDGDLDLFVANRFYATPESSITDRLYRNDGDGTFTDVGEALGVAVPGRKTFMPAWFDYDRNGTQDLYLAVDFGNDRLYRNNGRGGFTDVTAAAGITGPEHAMGVAVGDIDGDGCFDLVSTNNTRGRPEDPAHGPSTLYVSDCDGRFSDRTREWGMADRGTVDWGVSLVDWDNDGDQDLAIVSGGMLEQGERERNVLYENRGGRLVDVTRSLGAGVTGAAFGAAWADYDRDGDLDWLIVNSKRNPALLENRVAGGHWLNVRLKGRGANRDGIGARVELVAAGRRQVRTLQAGKGFAASEEPQVHFGLGVAGRVQSLRVIWPDGVVTEQPGPVADQTVTVGRR